MKDYHFITVDFAKCPGDGYVWDNRIKGWMKPKSVDEYRDWLGESWFCLEKNDEGWDEVARLVPKDAKLEDLMSRHKKPDLSRCKNGIFGMP